MLLITPEVDMSWRSSSCSTAGRNEGRGELRAKALPSDPSDSTSGRNDIGRPLGERRDEDDLPKHFKKLNMTDSSLQGGMCGNQALYQVITNRGVAGQKRKK
jgi:hypothetical protein